MKTMHPLSSKKELARPKVYNFLIFKLEDVPFYNVLGIKTTNYKVAIKAINKDQIH
jgi:hypothetical protein